MTQLDLFSWKPPKARGKPQGGKNDDTRSCRCGANAGRMNIVWRDAAGFDHIECDACSTGPRFPYWRPAPGVFAGSVWEAIAFDALEAGGLA